jgi:hemerythrin-like metal-binding protein
MEKLPRLNWNPTYSVGLEFLDAQHRKLFNLFNQLSSTAESGSGHYLPVIRGLVDYLYFEFHQEHMAMMMSNYPGCSRQIREHQKFTKSVEGFLKDFANDSPGLGESMMVFLKSWIVDHTVKLDVQFGQYLLRNPQIHELIKNYQKTLQQAPHLYVVNS